MPRLARIARPVLHVGALAAAVSALLTFVIPALTGRFSGEFEDFSIERTAGAALLHGTDPYATFIPIAATTPVHGLGFDYPPVTACLFQPFAALPASVADGIWLCFGLACVVGGAVIVARTVLPARWPRVSLAVVTSLVFAPATYNLWHGNINVVMFLTLALAVEGRRRSVDWVGFEQHLADILQRAAIGGANAKEVLHIAALGEHGGDVLFDLGIAEADVGVEVAIYQVEEHFLQ